MKKIRLVIKPLPYSKSISHLFKTNDIIFICQQYVCSPNAKLNGMDRFRCPPSE